MKSAEYWSKRMEDLNEAQLAKGETYIQTMGVEYEKAMASIQKDIDVFYQRFAKNNEVDLATARQMLSAGQLKEFKWSVEEYIQRGRENAIDQRWMKELENASIRVRMSRLEALQMQMRQQVELLSAKRQTGTQIVLGDIYKDNYYRSIFELQKGKGLGSSFAKLDTRQTESLLTTPWAPDGKNFSARIWEDRTKLVSELQTHLVQGLIRGDPSEKMIASLSERMGVSRARAENLVLTESAYFSGASRRSAYTELDVKEFQNIATLDKKTSTTCRTMDKTIFKVDEAQPGLNCAPFHGRCRTVDIPHYNDNIKERAARGEDGKTYEVPGDMTYKEWAIQNAPEAIESPKIEKPVTTIPPSSQETSAPPGASEPVNQPELAYGEEAAVMRYVGGESYVLNDKLRRGVLLNGDELKWIKQLDGALDKLPKHQGTVTRSLYFATEEDLSQFMQDYTPANVVQYNEYLSTTKGEKYNPSGQVQIYILNAALGRDISKFNPIEKEVLYGRNSGFEVLEIELLNGVYHILLREMGT